MPVFSTPSASAWKPQWRTETFAELNRPLSQAVGAKTAKVLANLKTAGLPQVLRALVESGWSPTA